MSSDTPPRPGPVASVTSLVDRLPRARRARLLAGASLRARGLSQGDVAHLESLAEYFAEMDPEPAAGALERLPPDHAQRRDALPIMRAMIGARRLLEGDAEGAFAVWEAAVAELGEEAEPVLAVRGHFRMTICGELEAALADLDRAVVLAPTEGFAYAWRGAVHHRMGHLHEALANYRRAVQLLPGNVNALLGAARCLERLDAHEEAIAWYARALQREPAWAGIRVERARCLEAVMRHDEAIAELSRAIAQDGGHAGAYLARARCRFFMGRTGALEDADRCVALDPMSPGSWYTRARLRLEAGDVEGADADAAHAVSLDADSAAAQYTHGLVHKRRGDLPRAFEALEAAVRRAPEDGLYVEALVEIAWEIGTVAAVRSLADTLTAVAPGHPKAQQARAEVHAAQGRMLAGEGDLAGAVAELGAALAVEDGLAGEARAAVHRARSTSLFQLARLPEALLDAERAAALAPDDRGNHLWLGLMLVNAEGDLDRAEAAMVRANELVPGSAAGIMSLALVRERQGRWDEAIAGYEQAIALDPTMGTAFYRRGLIRWHTAANDDARRAAIADVDHAATLSSDVPEILAEQRRMRRALAEDRGELAELDREIAADPTSARAF